MGNQRPKKKQGNKKNGKKHHVYAVIVLLLAAAIIIIGGILLFYIQEIEVSGNEYCDSQEIVNCVQNDKLSDNSLYVVAKYSMGKGTVPKCLDSLKVRMKNPWTLQITVKEKAITGCVKTGTTYSYFDQSGLSCAVFSAQGMNFGFFYNKIHIVQRLDAWKRLCDMLHFKNCLAQSITLFFVYRSFPHIGSSDPCTASAVHGLPVCNLYSTIPAQVSSALS